MARKRYASDEERARPFVRVHLTIRNHPTYGAVFDDPELRGMWLGVLVVARGAHAGKTGNVVSLSVGDILWITGRQSIRDGLPALQRLCTAMRWELDGAGPAYRRGRDGKLTGHRRHNVKVRNYERKQGLRSATPDPPIPSTDTDTEEEKTRSADAPPTPSPEAIEFARKFRASLKARTPDTKLPSESAFERWIVEADRMYRLDDRQHEEAEELARWLFNDTGDDAAFWRANVRAVPKFRTRFEELREHRARGERKGKTDGRSNIRDAAEAVARRRGLIRGGAGEEDPAFRSDAGGLPGGEKPGP